jgi:catechol 2,3-dioxygenase-like lactoylglutathione lyase family enzyme
LFKEQMMTTDFETLLSSYDRGTLTRRQLLTALAVIGSSASLASQQSPSGVVRPTTMDHVSLLVADPARTEVFYRALFGFPAARPIPSTGKINGFDLQGGYFTFQQSSTPGRIDHFCVAVEGAYDIQQVGEQLEAAGIKASIAGGGTTGYVIDPDGIRVQLSPTSNRQSKLPFPTTKG